MKKKMTAFMNFNDNTLKFHSCEKIKWFYYRKRNCTVIKVKDSHTKKKKRTWKSRTDLKKILFMKSILQVDDALWIFQDSGWSILKLVETFLQFCFYHVSFRGAAHFRITMWR